MSNTNDLIKQEEYRDFIKRLKEKKLFMRFYLACAEAFQDDTFPRNALNSYLNDTVKDYIDKGTVDEFVTGVEKWSIFRINIIQQ